MHLLLESIRIGYAASLRSCFRSRSNRSRQIIICHCSWGVTASDD